MKRLAAAALAAALLGGALQARADTVVEVARATVRMPAGEWVTLSRGRVDAVRVNDQRSIPAEVVALALVQGSQVDAVVTITATEGGAGSRVSWPTACKPTDDGLWAMRPVGANPEDLECAYASAPFPAEDFFSDDTAWGRTAKAKGLSVPDEVVLASAEVGSRMGALMQVEVLAGPDFMGSPGALEPLAPKEGIDSRHAAFALQLASRVRECVYSLRGRMDFPPMVFAAAAPAETPIARHGEAPIALNDF